jgi:putative OPT family oligopeptide transporter
VGWFVLIPLINYFAPGMTEAVGNNVGALIGNMSAEDIFANYIRPVGIGGIAMAGVIGILRSGGIIKKAFGLAVTETFSRKRTADKKILRTQRDIPMVIIGTGILITAVLIFVFFQFGLVHNIKFALIGLAIVLVIAFLFTTVAANAIAIVGTNPVSGMTLMTLIIASLILVSAGMEGKSGMVTALIIGGVVCTALSMAGGFITDLKIGYWLGSTPAKQQSWKFLGTLVSAATVGGVIIILNKTYGFTGENALVAPQANAMAAVIEPMMSGKPAPWLLYAAGAFLSLILTLISVPALPFALGMFIPLQLNTPLLIGGLIAHFVGTRSKDDALNKARKERGTLLASGFIAGGALMGVVSAALRFGGINFVNETWYESHTAEIIAIVMFAALCGYLIWETMRAKKEVS